MLWFICIRCCCCCCIPKPPPLPKACPLRPAAAYTPPPPPPFLLLRSSFFPSAVAFEQAAGEKVETGEGEASLGVLTEMRAGVLGAGRSLALLPLLVLCFWFPSLKRGRSAPLDVKRPTFGCVWFEM